ncbi:hypothetical protein RJT34_02403 [Clitoria ternatea]|uniref:Mind bomb SH3 repeat domain-containing protein n=1 Tax=Clitoria ternatea TaxID=43366 RepID=A0AAN9KHQ8_CLITE
MQQKKYSIDEKTTTLLCESCLKKIYDQDSDEVQDNLKSWVGTADARNLDGRRDEVPKDSQSMSLRENELENVCNVQAVKIEELNQLNPIHYEKVPSFKVGQYVRFQMGLVKPRWAWRGANPESQGVITSIHADGDVRIAFFGLPGLWRGDPSDLEIEKMFEVGEWVRLKDNTNHWKSIGPGSVGVVQGIGYESNEVDKSTFVGFYGEQEKWVGPTSHLERFGMANSLLDRKLKLSNLLSNQDLDSQGTLMLVLVLYKQSMLMENLEYIPQQDPKHRCWTHQKWR